MTVKEFKEMPVMKNKYLRAVPMDMLRPFEKQAIRNHGQTLTRLAERGGMCAAEILAVMDGRKWGEVRVCDENDLLLLRRVEAWSHKPEEAQ